MILTDKEYFSRTEISNSDLSLIKQSYEHYLQKQHKVTTDAMVLGKAFDQLLLRPDVFGEEFIVLPADLNRRTNEGKKIYADYLSSGRGLLSVDDWTDINTMKVNVLAHPVAKNIIKNAVVENCYFGELEGIPVRMKYDILNDGWMFDVKTCQDASLKAFQKDIGQRAYHRQCAFYVDILRQNMEGIKGAGFIAVEKPTSSKVLPINSGVGVYLLDDQSMEYGRDSYKALLKEYKLHRDNPKMYHGYSDTAQIVTCPLWATEGY